MIFPFSFLLFVFGWFLHFGNKFPLRTSWFWITCNWTFSFPKTDSVFLNGGGILDNGHIHMHHLPLFGESEIFSVDYRNERHNFVWSFNISTQRKAFFARPIYRIEWTAHVCFKFFVFVGACNGQQEKCKNWKGKCLEARNEPKMFKKKHTFRTDNNGIKL